MPAYDYRCSQCQQVFEVRRSMTEAEKPAVCPDCHGMQTARVYSAPNVVGGAHQASSGGCGSCSSAQSSACSTCRSTH